MLRRIVTRKFCMIRFLVKETAMTLKNDVKEHEVTCTGCTSLKEETNLIGRLLSI